MTDRTVFGALTRVRFYLPALLMAFIVLPPAGFGQDDEGDEDESSNLQSRLAATSPDTSEEVAWRARLGHLAFETFGRKDSITHVEVMPIVWLQDDMILFSDFRFFIDNLGQVGGNVGAGYRARIDGLDQILGLSAWYDADDTSGEFFHQAGFGVELLGEDWDVLFNGYFPVSDDVETARRITNTRFSGNQILFDQVREMREALQGVDLGVAVRLPGETAEEHDLRVYGGWYHFKGDSVPDIDGFRIRLSSLLLDNVSSQIEFTHDDTYGSNVIIGGSILLTGSFRAGSYRSSPTDHLKRFAQRNYNVITDNRFDTTSGLVAMNAATGSAFSVQHVSSSGSGGATGTAADPHATVAQAQASTPDIVFVHAGSTLSDAITLQANQSLLGEGIDHLIDADGFGTITLPTATAGTTLPVLQSVAGNAVAMAEGSRLSGFTINTPTGHGVIASAVGNFTIDNVAVTGAALDGIFLENLSGPATLSNINIGDATGASLHVDGTSADVTVAGTINNTTGRSVLIENTSDNTTVNLNGTTVTDSGAGLLISDVDGDVFLRDVTVTGSTGTGIEVTGGNGNVFFNGVTTVNTTNGPGIDIQNRTDDAALAGTQGQTVFVEANVTTDAQTGLFVRNAEFVGIGAGSINSTNSGAIADIEDSAIDVRLSSIFADGGAFGLRLEDTTGLFSAIGTGNFGDGGTIQNTTTALQLQNAGTVILQLVDFDANQTVITDTGSAQISLSALRITNTPGGGPAAIISLNDTASFELTNSQVNSNTAQLIDAVFNTNSSYAYSLFSNTITSDVGDVMSLTANAGAAGATLSLQASSNVLTMNQAGTDFVDLTWNGQSVVNVIGNTVTSAADSQRMFAFTNTHSTDLSTINVQSNTFTFAGANSLGTTINATGPSSIAIQSNTFDFDGANGIGMRFNLQDSSNIGIISNLLTDDGSAATAVLFDTVDENSALQFDNNLFSFNSPSAFVDRGLVVTSVGGTGNLILTGSINNLINGATTSFLFPAGRTTGAVPINGVFVP